MARVNKTRRMQVKRKEEKKYTSPATSSSTSIQKEEVSERETRSAKKQKLEAKFLPEELQVMQDVDVVFPYELAEKILTEEGIDQPMVVKHYNEVAIRHLLAGEVYCLQPKSNPASVEAITKLKEVKEKILGDAEEAMFKHILEVKQELFWVYKFIDCCCKPGWQYTVEDIEHAVEKAKAMMLPSSQDNLALWRTLNKD